jgi:hypothetical protein
MPEPSPRRSIVMSCGDNWSYLFTDYFKTFKLFTGFMRGDLPIA